MFLLLIKNGVAMSKMRCNNIDNIKMTLYDTAEEITEKEFKEIQLPAKKEGEAWGKTTDAPFLDLADVENEDEQPQNSVYDELAAAYREGVQEA